MSHHTYTISKTYKKGLLKKKKFVQKSKNSYFWKNPHLYGQIRTLTYICSLFIHTVHQLIEWLYFLRSTVIIVRHKQVTLHYMGNAGVSFSAAEFNFSLFDAFIHSVLTSLDTNLTIIGGGCFAGGRWCRVSISFSLCCSFSYCANLLIVS